MTTEAEEKQMPFDITKMNPDKLSIQANKLDMLTFEHMLQENEALDGITKKYCEKAGNQVKELANDLANSLMKYNPRLKGSNDIMASHRHNRGIVQRGMQTKEYERLREHTVGDRFTTQFATATILDKVMESLDDKDIEKMKQQSEQAEDLQNQAQQTGDRATGLQQALQDMRDQITPEQAQQMQQQMQQAQQAQQAAQQQLQQLEAEIEDTSNAIGQQVRMAMRSAMQEASEEAETMETLGAGWGLGPGQLQQLPYEDKANLAEQLRQNKTLKEVAKLLGSLKRIALQKRTEKFSKAPEEVIDIETGNDLSRLVTSEAAILADPETEDLFYKKFFESKLLLYKMQGKDKEGQGPIISCVDTSGSMCGEREIWAKAMTLALLEVAGKEKRDFAVVYFGSRNQFINFEIPKDLQGAERFERIMEIATYAFHGGTDFETPINEARKLIETQEYKKADIVMITDGDCDVSEPWLEKTLAWRKESQTLIQGIYVETQPTWRNMEKFCQETLTLSDLTDKNEQKKAYGVFRMLN